MNTRARAATVGLVTAVVCLSLGCQCGWLIPWPPTDPLCAEAPYSPLPPDFTEEDLVGTWETRYGRRTDKLVLRDDGTFKQMYRDITQGDYAYETPWSEWWLERFADGRIRLHLRGARYYVDGTRIGELDGYAYGLGVGNASPGDKPSTVPWPFYDPFTHQHLEMVGELILNVRVDSQGQILLHHMSYTSNGGFVMSGCQQDQFRRIETP
ncbi:MAG TPA: hypothetical protein VM537_33025 [Anaerolineae bacterium]|nr:hypothetical protein [Anaerolineae bacterium]